MKTEKHYNKDKNIMNLICRRWASNKNKHLIIFAVLCICILSCTCSCAKEVTPAGRKTAPPVQSSSIVKEETPKETVDYSGHSFAVHYIDVGQGDAALVLCDDRAMLIDGGKPRASSIIYTYLKKLNIDYLDYIVASHADDDHIGGLSAPLAKMKVGNVLAPETEADTRSYESLKIKTAGQGLSINHPKPGESLDFGSSKIEFYGPITENENDRNNGSVVMKIIYGDTSFLFTGDAEREEEQEILNAGYDLSATVLKVRHHGSRNSTTYPFLREIMPKYAVISVGYNSYGHPTEDVLSRLRDADVKVYRTDMQGDIIAESDGKTVTVTTRKNENVLTNPTENEKADIAEQANQEACTYIGNVNTKKFHYPECSAVLQMNDENKDYLNCTRDEVLEKGYSPCGRCNP